MSGYHRMLISNHHALAGYPRALSGYPSALIFSSLASGAENQPKNATFVPQCVAGQSVFPFPIVFIAFDTLIH